LELKRLDLGGRNDRGTALYRYESRRDPRTELRERIREIAQVRVRYGYRRVHVLLHREGWKANHKLVYRLYREEGLALRRKRPKRHVSAVTARHGRSLRRLTRPGAWIASLTNSCMEHASGR
jgi:transposase InsO family protein